MVSLKQWIRNQKKQGEMYNPMINAAKALFAKAEQEDDHTSQTQQPVDQESPAKAKQDNLGLITPKKDQDTGNPDDDPTLWTPLHFCTINLKERTVVMDSKPNEVLKLGRFRL